MRIILRLTKGIKANVNMYFPKELIDCVERERKRRVRCLVKTYFNNKFVY